MSSPKRSPSALSTEFLKEQGYVVDTAERFIPGANIRKDLFGLFDLVGLAPQKHGGLLGVQVTSRAHMPDRRKKMQERGYLSLWLAAGNRAELHGWRLEGPRGQRRWEIKIEEVVP